MVGNAAPQPCTHPPGAPGLWGAGFSLRGGGGSIEPPKTGGGGFGKRAQLTDTIITVEKKLRSHFWQGLCTSDFVPLLGTPQLMWFQ